MNCKVNNTILLFFLCFPIVCYSTCSNHDGGSTISIEQSKICYKQQVVNNKKVITFYLDDKKLNFVYDDFSANNDDLDMGANVRAGYKENEINIFTGYKDNAVDKDYQVYTYFYDKKKRDLILERVTNIEYQNNKLFPNITTQVSKCCYSMNDVSSDMYESRVIAEETLAYIKSDIYKKDSAILNRFDEDRKGIPYPIYWIPDLNMILDTNNVRVVNDFAFYLQKYGLYEDSGILLEKIVHDYPKRTVAHLNLADTYWALDEKTYAKNEYEKYIKLMISDGKENKIPEVVKERVK